MVPLDVTMSIGDVCFRLVAAKQHRQHSPPTLNNDGNDVVAVGDDGGNSNEQLLPGDSLLQPPPSSLPSVPQSPVTRHIVGRVRAMKYEIESRRQLLVLPGGGEDCASTAAGGNGGSIRRHSSASLHQGSHRPLPVSSFFPPNNCNDDDSYSDHDDDTDTEAEDGAPSNVNNNDVICMENNSDDGNYYTINLRSFTGTLRVYLRSQSSTTMNHNMQSSARNAKQNATIISAASIPSTTNNIRNTIPEKTSISTMNDGCTDDDNDDENDNNIEIVLEQDGGNQTSTTNGTVNEHETIVSSFLVNNGRDAESSDEVCNTASSRRRRSVRFSLPPGKEGDGADTDDSTSILHASNKANDDALPPSPPPLPPPQPPSLSSPYPSPSPQPPNKKPGGARRSFLHSPPFFSYASPPRGNNHTASAKAKNIARETSTLLARSSKHVLRQVTLAGKDAYDIVLNGDGGDWIGGKMRYSISSSAKKRGGSSSLDENDGDDDDDVNNAQDNGTELHHACASHNLSRVRTLLLNGGSAGDGTIDDLRKCDRKGRLPLHIFVNNRNLIESDPKGCEEVVLAMIDCMGGPDVIVRNADALSSCGLIPFVYVLGLWVDRLHRGATMTTATHTTPLGGGRASILDDEPLVQSESAAAAQSLDDGNAKSSASSLTPEKAGSSTSPSRRRVTYRSLLPSSSSANDTLSRLQYIPTSVTISNHERWAVRILSRLIDEHVEMTREAILTNLASVPLFLKSVLLIDDAEAMTEVLNSSLVRHAVVDKRSINVWLCAMLTNTKEVKVRAVTFLKLLSRLTLVDLASSSQSPDRFSAKEMERFTTCQEETFNAVYVMPGFVPAVLELGGLTIENISTSRVMRYITDRTIRKESVFFVLILDFFYSLFLLMGYRLNVEFVLFYQDVNGPEYYNEHTYISTSIRGIAGYFFIKEALTLLSLYMTSTKLAKRYCMSVFNIIDFASVAMLLLTEGVLTTNGNLIDNEGFAASLTVILLWLKLMGAFKILNSAFALFLYAVDEVMKKVKWFLLFLFMITFMFSDAARTIVAARGDCRGQIDLGIYLMDEFCSDSLFKIVVRMYSVLVGDVNLADFQSSKAMVVIFVLFTFFSIIICLNILIAIIIDSYQGSKKVRVLVLNRRFASTFDILLIVCFFLLTFKLTAIKANLQQSSN